MVWFFFGGKYSLVYNRVKSGNEHRETKFKKIMPVVTSKNERPTEGTNEH